MMMTNDELKIEDLKQGIKSGNKDQVITMMETFKQECLTSEQLHILITMPVVITELHQLLVQHMDVHPKTMQLRKRVQNTRRRAILFLQAMINGVNLRNV